MKEKFIAFLKKHKAYRRFNVALGSETIDQCIARCDSVDSNYIGGAFIWEDTNEGHDYWGKLSKLWSEECKN